ncbi:hypothetical protein Gpo141_00006611 [Globisporangium polare]
MWLSAPTTSIVPRRSPRDGSAPPQQQLESMVRAAHQHLSDSSSPNNGRRPPFSASSQRTPRTESPVSAPVTLTFDDEPLLSLDEHMESFPLVPLSLIPRLSLADLRKCERGLLQLLESLNRSSPEEDAQLGKYATRQLSLVQRHVEQARARERVLQLLSGDTPQLGSVISQSTQGRPGSAKALAIFLSPPANPSAMSSRYSKPEHNDRSSSGSTSAPSPSGDSIGATAKSPLAKTAARKKREAIEAARAMIKASLAANNNNKPGNSSQGSTLSAFVITAGDHSSSNSNAKRRRRLQKKKSTPEELEKARALQVEKERERRRQEAYQRLIARQELQAEKKKKQQQPQVGNKPEKVVDSPVKSGGGGQQNGSEPGNGVQTESGGVDLKPGCDPSQASTSKSVESESESESESDDGSEVSNCSDSDEANERAIMALQVQVRVTEAEGEDEEVEETGGDRAEAHGEDSEEDHGVSDSDHEVDDNDEAQDADRHDGEKTGRPTSRPEMEDSQTEDAVPDGEALDSDVDGRHAASDEDDEREVEREATNKQTRETEEQQQIALDLQEFISHRKSAMMEQLQQQKQRRLMDELHVDNQPALLHSESLNDTPERDQADLDRSGPHREAKVIKAVAKSPPRSADTKLPSQQLQGSSSAHTAKQSRPRSGSLIRKPQSQASFSSHTSNPTQQQQKLASSASRSTIIPRAPVKPCKDYRNYFPNFHCILTSVFEQRHAFSSSNTTSRDALMATAPSHAPVHEQSLRIQLKLYEGWQSIMQDYATVFGGNIATPRSMLPASGSSGLLPSTAHYRINSTTRREVCDIVVTALEKLGDWDEHPSGLGLKTTWNLLWTWSKPRVERKALLAWQKVNHFQHAKALTRKDCLKKNMGKYLAMGGRMKQAYDVTPLTFILPHEYIAFVQAFQDKGARLRASSDNGTSGSRKNIWIMKPVALSRGRGISLIDDLSQVVYGEQVVIQEYIANPLLLDGYKFDLRLYVLVTSFNPLEAFFYDEGFVRICTRQYEDADLTNLFVHLTNSSIQKENQDAIQASDNPINAAAGEEAGGTKMTLAYLWKRLEAMGADVERVKSEITEVILKSLLCGEDHIPFQVNSFDLYGYDILLDDAFRPWLIEINSSPSMARENDLDYQVKDALILDTIRLVDPLRFDRAKFVDVVARRLQDSDSEKKRPHAHIRHPKEAEELAARQLNEDLTEILQGKVPRAYGELPEHLGGYRRICPHTTSYNQLVKLKKSCVRVERRV